MIPSFEKLAAKSFIPALALGSVVFITGMVLFWSTYSEYNSYRVTVDNYENQSEFIQLRGLILQLDEVLTMSVRMAAVTGDRKWEERYRVYEPELNAVIQALENKVPGVFTKEAVQDTDLANKKLVEIENRAFALMHQNRLREARVVLSSKEYETQREFYHNGMNLLMDRLNKEEEAIRQAVNHQTILRVISRVIVVVILISGWAVVLRISHLSRRKMIETGIQLAQRSKELAEMNTTLDRKVAERTRDLKETQIASLNMMEDAVEARAKAEQAYKELLEEVDVRKQAEEMIQHMAFYDTLTDLPNRNMLYDRLLNAIRTDQGQGKPVALLLMDLDRFKEINDTLGHDRGDRLLQEVGRRLRESMFERDLVARLGGDEFGVLLVNTANAKDIDAALQKILKALELPFLIEDLPIMVEGSIGLALYPDHGLTAEDLFRKADIAMHISKRDGIPSTVYDPAQDKHSPQQLSLMGELHHAIEHNELCLFYQPKISLKTQRTIGVEALVRWKHPSRGMVPPDQFILPAEQTGLIHPLTRWVTAEGMRQCKAWREAGIELTVSVNLSTRNLLDPTLLDQVAGQLRSAGAAPDWMTFEITESAIMTDPAHALEVLTKLHEMGIHLAIDDFGVGYSSLVYLQKLPVDTIKIDKSFVINVSRNPNDALIVRSTIDLAHNLGRQVVAEGVEDKDIWDRLSALGCDEAQGYYMARPMPAEDLVRWLSESPWGLKAGSMIPG